MNAIELTARSASGIEQDVFRLGKLQSEGRHEEALQAALSLLQSLPENRDLMLIAAVSLRHLKRIAEAQTILDRLEKVRPRFSRLHEERGLCHVALKDAPRAIDALLRAVNINPALPLSWRMLEGLYRLVGDRTNAATAAAHMTTLQQLPDEVLKATALFADGEHSAAEQIVRPFLLRHGNHPEGMRLLAKIALVHDALDDAEILLEGVVALAPDHRAARYEYADTLLKRQKYAAGQEVLRGLLVLDPAHIDYRALMATALVGLGEHGQAIALYRAMIADAPHAPDLHLWLGHALKTVGQVPEAITAYRAAATARPDFGDAYWSLANLKTYRFLEDELTQMRAREQAPETALEDRYHLCFALGKALEDRNEIAESWSYYARGNGLKRAESSYRPEILETNTVRQMEVCTQEFFQARAGWGVPARDPIFILGLPRSGSTLVEQILASHPLVEGTQELSDIQRIVLELQGRDPDPDNPRYPHALIPLERDGVRRLGEKYLADTRVYRGAKPFFIDKMPNNFRHIGLIHLLLPNARIIDARRDPMGCCFSNLKQLFAHGQEFSYSVEDIARYYRTYLELMRHWDQVLPGRVLRMRHQDVVDDLEGSVRRILDYCGLEFDRACVEFHNNRRSVRTPSSEQVRQPIFREGLDQWKRYEPWLGPLKAALGDALIRYSD